MTWYLCYEDKLINFKTKELLHMGRFWKSSHMDKARIFKKKKTGLNLLKSLEHSESFSIVGEEKAQQLMEESTCLKN